MQLTEFLILLVEFLPSFTVLIGYLKHLLPNYVNPYGQGLEAAIKINLAGK